MLLYDGEVYKDDRLFILDYGIAGEQGEQGWYVATRRNTQSFPAFRVDRFASESEVIEFIKKLEPETPRISLGGKSPFPIPSYDDHLKWLRENQLPSSIEIHEMNKGPIIKVSLA
ncbi:MAG: hypothetical protein ACSLE4_03430 [Methyloceanibacter sp.]|uniref:hypothetical protein n=1 Tax=Methyloceanibacter sp. TaxID=1965321 RepID=UPI003EE30355